MEITFLGTGSAIPIPRRKTKFDQSSPLHDCPQCQSTDPRDRRWPSSLLIDQTILIDAPPPILSLLKSVEADLKDITTVVLTHRHQDAAGGLSTLPNGIHQVFPNSAGTFVQQKHTFESVKVPHDPRTWGYLVDGKLAYFSDYSDIRPAQSVLGKASVAVLDGSGWDRTFPTHQPMIEVIPVVKRFANLKQIYFTHVGHTHCPHSELERKTRELGDNRFSIAYHGLRLEV